ncbi:IS600 ORF2 [Shigella sonnei]|nr:IS600 ORF2 [Shigella sonnei]
MCQVFGVSRSGYYNWVQHEPSDRKQSDERLKLEIKVAHIRTRETYGTRRLQTELAENGIIVGRDRLATWLHNHVVRDIRLGSIEYKNVWRDYGFGDASGYVLTAAINSNADDIVDTVARRPIQKLIGGIWYNVGSV